MALLVLLAVAALSCAQCGCSVFESACTKALPALASSQALFDDAQTARDQALAVIEAVPDPRQRERALRALAVVDASLRAAGETLHAASTACSTPDVQTVFASFVSAWQALSPFLALLGGAESGSAVPTPIVVGMSR